MPDVEQKLLGKEKASLSHLTHLINTFMNQGRKGLTEKESKREDIEGLAELE